jgi:hypothetical protein
MSSKKYEESGYNLDDLDPLAISTYLHASVP